MPLDAAAALTDLESVSVDRNAVPVTVLTGFLGAGKTTLLNRILRGDHGLRVGVLVNDFGAINIDEQLVVGVEDSTISLANGCVCCEISDDLIDSIQGLIDRAERPEHIVLEASGVADPMGIAMTLTDRRVRDRIRLDGIVSIVDSEQVFANPDYPALKALKLRQVGYSDMVVLNKVDLVEEEQLGRVHAWIDERIPRVRKVETSYAEVPHEILLGVGEIDAGRLATGDGHGHSHDGPGFETWSYETERPLSLQELRRTIRKLPETVFRCKGIVHAAEEPERRMILQAVGRRSDVVAADEWGERRPRTQIVAIGTPDVLDPDELRERFDACVA